MTNNFTMDLINNDKKRHYLQGNDHSNVTLLPRGCRVLWHYIVQALYTVSSPVGLCLSGVTSGQVISADKDKIIETYYPGYFMQSVVGQLETKQTAIKHDDNYQGKTKPFLSTGGFLLFNFCQSYHWFYAFGVCVCVRFFKRVLYIIDVYMSSHF